MDRYAHFLFDDGESIIESLIKGVDEDLEAIIKLPNTDDRKERIAFLEGKRAAYRLILSTCNHEPKVLR